MQNIPYIPGVMSGVDRLYQLTLGCRENPQMLF